MFDLTLIGIGTGNPDHITRQGEQAIREADLILIPHKGQGKADLADLRTTIIDSATNGRPPKIACFDMPRRKSENGYLQGVSNWHDTIARVWQSTIANADPPPRKVALLIWGDPSLYDSALRIAARLDPCPNVRVVPGVTALQALTAAHTIPINDLNAAFTVTTGRQLRDHGWPKGTNRLAVMLDGDCSFQTLEITNYHIWWGAYLGMAEEILVAGRLDDVADKIMSTRSRARADHGWIMDVYLLKKCDA